MNEQISEKWNCNARNGFEISSLSKNHLDFHDMKLSLLYMKEVTEYREELFFYIEYNVLFF